jgi:amino acid transporter
VAVATVGAIALVVGLPVSISQGGFLAFAYIGALSGLSLIIIFITVSVAVIVAFRRRFRSDFNPVLHLLLPVLGIVTFSIPLVGTFYPVPASPFNIFPYCVLGVLALGIIVSFWLKQSRPELLSRIGRVFLVEGPEQPYPSAIPPSTRIEEGELPA